MTTQQPEALRLADIVERLNVGVHSQAIAEEYTAAALELRRLHARISDLEAQLAAAPQAVQVIKANCYSDDNGDYWRDCPDDCDFVDGLKVGDTYELQASIRAWSETFRVTKSPDETSDDYEVELVSTDAPLAAAQPAAQGMEQDAARYHWLRKSPNPACDIALAKHFGGGRGQDFDALIDAALAAQAKQGEQANG